MQDVVSIKVHPPGGTVILDRAEKRNALNRFLLLQIKRALEDLHQEKRVRAIILTGAGSAFSAGTDLEEMRSTWDDPAAEQQWHEDVMQYQELIELMLRYPKPIISAVNGPALGTGAGLVLASDICLVCPETQIAFPEPRRGLVAGQVAPLAAFRLGGAFAARMLLGGAELTGKTALQVGLAHQLVASEQLWAAAQVLAAEIAAVPSEALQATKRVLNETVGEQLSTWLSGGSAQAAAARTTDAAREGVVAFLEKRLPQWP